MAIFQNLSALFRHNFTSSIWENRRACDVNKADDFVNCIHTETSRDRLSESKHGDADHILLRHTAETRPTLHVQTWATERRRFCHYLTSYQPSVFMFPSVLSNVLYGRTNSPQYVSYLSVSFFVPYEIKFKNKRRKKPDWRKSEQTANFHLVESEGWHWYYSNANLRRGPHNLCHIFLVLVVMQNYHLLFTRLLPLHAGKDSVTIGAENIAATGKTFGPDDITAPGLRPVGSYT